MDRLRRDIKYVIVLFHLIPHDFRDLFGYDLQKAAALYECPSIEGFIKKMSDSVRLVNSDRGIVVVGVTLGMFRLFCTFYNCLFRF